MSPRNHDMDVSRGSLQYQASEWGKIAEAVGKVSSEIGKLDPAGNPGPFSDFVNQYVARAENIGIWTGQGKTEMNKIALALQQSVALYDDTENKNLTHIRSIGN